MEKLIKSKHLKQYVWAYNGQDEMAQEASEGAPTSPTIPRAVINYIHGGLVDDKYHFIR